MKLIELYNASELYSKLSSRTDLSIKTVYKLAKLFEVVNKESEFYKESLVKILNEYAARDENGAVILTEDGKNIKIKDEFIQECNNKLQELANLEIEKPKISFSLEEIPEGLSVREFNLLMPFIEE